MKGALSLGRAYRMSNIFTAQLGMRDHLTVFNAEGYVTQAGLDSLEGKSPLQLRLNQ